MYAPVLLALGLLSRLIAGVPVDSLLERGSQRAPQCRRDACLDAVVSHNKAHEHAAYEDCVEYQRTTVTPHAVTVTAAQKATVTKTCATVRGKITHTSTCTSTSTTSTTVTDTVHSTSYTTVATVTATAYTSGATATVRRSLTHAIPRYAKGVCKAGHYTSACRCIHAPTETETLRTPTTTVTPTHTACVTGTKMVGTATTTTAVVVTTTATRHTTVTAPTVVATTHTTTVTPVPTGPVFILYDRLDPDHAVSVASGVGTRRATVGTSPATRWYLGADGSLHSVANSGEPAGIDVSVALPYVTVHDDTADPPTTYPGLTCKFELGRTAFNDTGMFNCTAPGFPTPPGWGDCDGNLVYTDQRAAGAPRGQCANFSSFSLSYQIVQAATPIIPRDVERGQARHRRKRRPLPAVVPEEVALAVASV